MNGSHHIGLIGIDRIFIRFSHNRLSREMENDLRFFLLEHRLQMGKIPDIPVNAVHILLQAENLKQAGPLGHPQPVTRHIGSGPYQDTAEPASLKPRMPGQEHSLSSEKFQIRRHLPPPSFSVCPAMPHWPASPCRAAVPCRPASAHCLAASRITWAIYSSMAFVMPGYTPTQKVSRIIRSVFSRLPAIRYPLPLFLISSKQGCLVRFPANSILVCTPHSSI